MKLVIFGSTNLAPHPRARDQPVASVIGCRKTTSENIAPAATQVIPPPPPPPPPSRPA